jgi:hypothetical protein
LVVLQCSPASPGRIDFRLRLVKVLELWRCDFQGRVFAYGARYEPQGVQGGKPYRTLESISVLFCDVDGSGKFVSMRYPSGLLFKTLEVPDWAKTR